jgi:hypothetical protein
MVQGPFSAFLGPLHASNWFIAEEKGHAKIDGFFGTEGGKSLSGWTNKGVIKWHPRARPRAKPTHINQGRGKTSVKGRPILAESHHLEPETQESDQADREFTRKESEIPISVRKGKLTVRERSIESGAEPCVPMTEK